MKANIPERYKLTEVGVIPNDWDVNKLKDCLIKNPDYGINAPAVPYSDSLPTYIRITDISEDGNFLPENKASVIHHNAHDYFLEVGDIVFARTGASTGKSYLYNIKDGKLVFAGFLIRVKPDPQKLYPRYLKGYLETQAYWNWVKIMSMRSGQPGINGNEYSQLQIPLPPLTEQKAIALSLSDTDALITQCDRLITKKHHIKQGTMQQLLTGKKRLPGFSGEWEVNILEEVSKLSSGTTPSRKLEDRYYSNGNINWVKTTDLNNGEINDTEEKITELALNETCLRKYDIGTVLVAMYGGFNQIGRTGLLKIVATVNQALIAIQPQTKILDSIFLINYLNFQVDYWKHIAISSRKDPNITSRDVKKFPIPLPCLLEQQAIAQILSDMDTEIAALEQKRNKYKALKQGMMQELLTGKTRL